MTAIDATSIPGPPAPSAIPGEPRAKSLIDRVATRSEQVRITRVVFGVLAAPLFVLGFLAAVVVVAARWMIGGLIEGFLFVYRPRGDES